MLLYFNPIGPLSVKGDDRILSDLKGQIRIHGRNGDIPDRWFNNYRKLG